MALTEEEKTQLKEEIIARIKAEGTDIGSLAVATSLDGVSHLPAYDGSRLVGVPPDLLSGVAAKADISTLDDPPTTADFEGRTPALVLLTAPHSSIPEVSVGVLLRYSDNMEHVLTQELHTHYVLNDDGTLSTTAHNHHRVFVYTRSFTVTGYGGAGDDGEYPAQGEWGEWEEKAGGMGISGTAYDSAFTSNFAPVCAVGGDLYVPLATDTQNGAMTPQQKADIEAAKTVVDIDTTGTETALSPSAETLRECVAGGSPFTLTFNGARACVLGAKVTEQAGRTDVHLVFSSNYDLSAAPYVYYFRARISGTAVTLTLSGICVLQFAASGTPGIARYGAASDNEAAPVSIDNNHDVFVWRKNLFDSCAKTARPTSTAALGAGRMTFDTTLGMPIWYTGSKWVDANGNTV